MDFPTGGKILFEPRDLVVVFVVVVSALDPDRRELDPCCCGRKRLVIHPFVQLHWLSEPTRTRYLLSTPPTRFKIQTHPVCAQVVPTTTDSGSDPSRLRRDCHSFASSCSSSERSSANCLSHVRRDKGRGAASIPSSSFPWRNFKIVTPFPRNVLCGSPT